MKKGFLKLLLLLMIIIPIKAKAVTFQITKSADNLKPGGVSTIIIKTSGVNDRESLATYTLDLKFDNSKLEFAGGISSAKSNVGVAGNNVHITSKFTDNETGDFEVARFNLKVVGGASSGNAALTLSGKCDINDVGAGGSCNTNSS